MKKLVVTMLALVGLLTGCHDEMTATRTTYSPTGEPVWITSRRVEGTFTSSTEDIIIANLTHGSAGYTFTNPMAVYGEPEMSGWGTTTSQIGYNPTITPEEQSPVGMGLPVRSETPEAN